MKLLNNNLPNRTPVPSGSLSIGGSLGLSPREENQATHRWDTLERVVEAVEKWGFTEAQRPKMEMPIVTAEMLMTPDVNTYASMYAATKDWYNYSNKLRARVVAELLQHTNEMNDIAAETRKRLRKENEGRPKNMRWTPEAIDDEITTNDRYRELKIHAQELHQLKYEIEARVEELESNMKVVSRNIEVRREEMAAGRKADGMPGRTRGERPWGGRG